MDISRRALVYGLGGVLGAGSLGAAASNTFGAASNETPIKALVAGSLLRLTEQVPGATIEAHGSAAVQQLVLNDVRHPDAVALADPRLFEGISSRATLFATNALVLTYAPNSEYASALQQDWKTAIQRDGIRLGRTDPNRDPLGYRTIMALRLAEDESTVDAQQLLRKTSVFRETDMLNVVEGGQIDAAFSYRNMAVQRDLPYVSLPDRINFSNPAYAETYGSVSYDLGETTLYGSPIRYAATALTETGRQWVESLVTATELLQRMGFLVPSSYPQRNEELQFDVEP